MCLYMMLYVGQGSCKKHHLIAGCLRIYISIAHTSLVFKGCIAWLQGPAAVGKTSLVTAIAQAQGRKVARVNNSDTTTIQDYFGSWLPVGKGACAFQKGVLYSCLESGIWLLADELNLAPPAVIMMLAPILEGHRTVMVPGSDRRVTVHPQFRCVLWCSLVMVCIDSLLLFDLPICCYVAMIVSLA